MSLGTYDLFHATAGISWIDDTSEFTIGLGYSWGTGELAVVVMVGYTYRFK